MKPPRRRTLAVPLPLDGLVTGLIELQTNLTQLVDEKAPKGIVDLAGYALLLISAEIHVAIGCLSGCQAMIDEGFQSVVENELAVRDMQKRFMTEVSAIVGHLDPEKIEDEAAAAVKS